MNLLSSVDAIYSNFNGRITRHWVIDEPFAYFSDEVHQLQTDLAEAGNDAVIRAALGWFKRLRYVLARTPLEFRHALDHCLPPPDNLADAIRNASAAYPVASAGFDRLRQAVVSLRASDAQLLRDVARLATADVDAAVAVVTGDRRYVACSRDALRRVGAEAVRVCIANDLAGLTTFDVVVLSGPGSWYPTWLRTAPRALETHVVCHSWINDRLEASPSLPSDSADVEVVMPRLISIGTRPHSRVPIVEARDLAPRVDAAALVRQAHSFTEDTSQEKAVLLILEEEQAVFLSADDASDALVIELVAGVPRVDHLTAREMREGMFVVLRTKGGVDYVRDVADLTLGIRAAPARALQAVWKDKLFERMRLEGTRAVVRQLQDRGIAHASVANVERWASARSIALAEKTHFVVLLHWLGLRDRLEVMWTNVELLRSAHMRAGATIRERLIAAIGDADPRELEARGRMDFTLSVPGAGALTAFRIAQITDGTHEVPSNQLGKPFEVRD